MSDLTLDSLPPQLQTIIEDFEMAEGKEKLELLLEYAMELPSLPPHLAGNIEAMEQVHECQSPFFVSSEVKDGQVMFYYDVPQEAPTIRGYASILAQGLNGSTPEQVINLPNNFYTLMGLGRVMSPLRLRGIQAVLNRMKRQMTEYLTA